MRGINWREPRLPEHRRIPKPDDLRSAHALARTQAAPVYELRCAVELLEMDPAARELVADAVARFPENSGWPELARARALLAGLDHADTRLAVGLAKLKSGRSVNRPSRDLYVTPIPS